VTYGLRPWELELLTDDEWDAICDDHEARLKAAEEG
jgi:hypothetical protein